MVFLSHLWRFSFNLSDAWGFLIFVNFSCCFLQNSVSWFSIVIIDLFSITWCRCNSSFRCSLLCVWFSGISLQVILSTVTLFLPCSSAVALICIDWVFVFLWIFPPDSFQFVCMWFMIFNKLSTVFVYDPVLSLKKKDFFIKKSTVSTTVPITTVSI